MDLIALKKKTIAVNNNSLSFYFTLIYSRTPSLNLSLSLFLIFFLDLSILSISLSGELECFSMSSREAVNFSPGHSMNI